MSEQSLLKLTAGLLWHDRFVVPVFFALLLGTLGLQELAISGSLELVFLSLIVERFTVLMILLLIVLRWAKILRVTKTPSTSPSFLSITRFFLLGFALWIALGIPLAILPFTPNREVELLATALLAAGIVTSLRYFFYFIPVPLGIAPPGRALTVSKEISVSAPWLQFKTLIAPCAWMLLIMNIFLAPAPDGRSEFWSTLASFGESIFWLLSCYTGMAAGLLYLGEPTWRELGFDPYRKERLRSLEVRTPFALKQLADPRFTSLVLSFGVLLSVGNHLRYLSTPPAAKIDNLALANHEKVLELNLKMKDPDFNLRGFSPYAFYIAGEQGLPLSTKLLTVKINGKEETHWLGTEELGPNADFFLSFEMDRNTEALKELEDVWLWYNHVRLVHLSPLLKASGAMPPPPHTPREHIEYPLDPHTLQNQV